MSAQTKLQSSRLWEYRGNEIDYLINRLQLTAQLRAWLSTLEAYGNRQEDSSVSRPIQASQPATQRRPRANACTIQLADRS